MGKRVVNRIDGWTQSIEESIARDAVLDIDRSIQADGYSHGAQSASLIFVGDPSLRTSVRVGLSIDAFRGRWDRGR